MFKNILKWGGNYLIIELKLLISARVTPPEVKNFAILEEKTLEIAHISYHFLFIFKTFVVKTLGILNKISGKK